MAVTKQNQQPAPSAMTQAMAEAMAQAQAQAQEQTIAQALAEEQSVAEAIIGEQKLQISLLEEQLAKLNSQIAEQAVASAVKAPSKVLDERLAPVLALCPFDTKQERLEWCAEVLGCHPVDFHITEESLNNAYTKAKKYIRKTISERDSLKRKVKKSNALLKSEKDYLEEKVDEIVENISLSEILGEDDVVIRPTRSKPQLLIVSEKDLRGSSSSFWTDAAYVAGGVAATAVVGYAVYKIAEHFLED